MILTPSTVKVLPLVSSLARFVQGDIKGGEHAHAYRTDIIRTAIEQAFKGNYSPVNEAATLTTGKAKKARAYHAGFATFGDACAKLAKVSYVGKLDSPDNKPARERIASLTKEATGVFFAAYDAVMAEKAEKKAKTVPAPTAAPVAETQPEADAVDAGESVTVDISTAVDAVVSAIELGMLSADELTLIRAALVASETVSLHGAMLNADRAALVATH